MNALSHRSTGTSFPAEARDSGAQPEHRLCLTLSVHDAAALWAAAADRGMAAPGARLEDVLDVIGPREDPAIGDCIAMLALPLAIPGCTIDDFWIDSMTGLPSRDELQRSAEIDASKRAARPELGLYVAGMGSNSAT